MFLSKKHQGDANIFILGMALTILTVFVFFFSLRIQQINILYDEMDEALSLSVLSSAIINREDEFSTQQTVVHELDSFTGGITAESDLQIMGNTDDYYLKQAYNAFVTTFTDNFMLDDNLIPKNAIVNAAVEVVSYTVYNVWYELDDYGYRTGNFRVCRYVYTPSTDSWVTTWYPVNQDVYFADSLTQTNKLIEYSTVCAQIKLTVTKLPYLSGVFEDNLTQDIYYQRASDIREDSDLIKVREVTSTAVMVAVGEEFTIAVPSGASRLYVDGGVDLVSSVTDGSGDTVDTYSASEAGTYTIIIVLYDGSYASYIIVVS